MYLQSYLGRRVRNFAHAHDDMPAFHAAFLVGTFFAAAVLNLGFFALLILGHMSLDIVKYRELHALSVRKTLRAVLLESLTDLTLFFIALACSVHVQHSFAIAAVSGIARAELTIIGALTVLLPKMEILEHMAHVYSHLDNYLHIKHPYVYKPLNIRQKICILLIIFCIALLFAAPVFFTNDANLLFLLSQELIPWRF